MFSGKRLIITGGTSLLAWSLWSHAQDAAGGHQHSPWAENLAVAAFPQAAGQQSSTQPTRNFTIFDATLYKQKPDLAGFGFTPVSMIFEGPLWPNGRDRNALPDKDLVVKAAAQASKSTGIAVIDIESWPLTGDPAVVTQSIEKYKTVMLWFKEAAPTVKVGYYGVAPVRNYWDALLAPEAPKYVAWQRTNDRLAEVARLGDFVCPSIYTFYEDQVGWSKYAIRQIQEARRISGGKPVYPFLWMEYHPSNKTLGGTNLPGDYWKVELETVRKYADGVVLWGGFSKNWDDGAAWWKETQTFQKRNVSGQKQ